MAVLACASTALQPLAAQASSFTYQVPLDGSNMSTPVAGALQASPAAFSFGTQSVGSSVVTTTVIRNAGQEAVSVTSMDIAAPFTQTNNCPSTLASGDFCTATVAFTPTVDGSFSGTLVVAAATGSTSFNVSATAVSPTSTLTVAPNALSFGAVNQGLASQPLTVKVVNTGTASASLDGVGVTSGATDFAQSNDCGTALLPGAFCTIVVLFTPTSGGPRSGNLSVFEKDSGTLYSVALTGTSNVARLGATAHAVDFGAVTANDSTSTGTITLTNAGNLAIQGLTADVSAGDFSQTATTCGASLAANANCTVSLKFTPNAAGARAATALFNSANGGSVSVALTGTGTAQVANVSVSQSTVSFNPTPVGTSSATQTVVFTNTGNIALAGQGVSLAAGTSNFQLTQTCGNVLAVGATCSANLAFSPTQAGIVASTLVAGFGNLTRSVSLTGTGTQANALANPSALTFATTQLAATTSSQAVTISNGGNQALVFTGIGVISGSTDFAQSNNCTTLAPSAQCTIEVAFTPSAVGTRTGSLVLAHDGTGVSLVVLTGEGVSASTALTIPAFAATQIGSNSTAVAVLTNTGIAPLSLTTPAMASVTGSDFKFLSTTCTSALASQASCSITVQFAPTAATTRTGTVGITTQAGLQSVAFSATAVQGIASVSASSLTFEPQQTGTTGAAQNLQVTNTGSAALSFGGIGLSSGASDFAQSNNCNNLAPGASCTLVVAFTPSEAGPRTGMLTLVYNGGRAASVSLNGSGVVPAAILRAESGQATTVGATSALAVTLTNQGSGPLSVGGITPSAVSGDGFSFSGTTCVASLPVNQTCTVTIQFAPTSAGTHAGQVTLVTNAGELKAALTATALQGSLTASSTSLNFSPQQVGASSGSQAVVLTNQGTAAVTLSGFGISFGASDFTQTNDCSTLAAGASCSIDVTFSPSGPGSRSGVLTFGHSGTGLTSVALAGTAQAASATLSAVDFGLIQTGQVLTKSATLSNTGIGSLVLSSVVSANVTGAYFTFVSSTCPATLSAGASCTLMVEDSPLQPGVQAGAVTLLTSAGPVTANLTSAAQAPAATLSTPAFASDYSGDSEGQLATATLTNQGVGPLTLTPPSASVVSGSDFSFAGTTCGATLPAGASCEITLDFVASGGGPRTGALSLTTNAGLKAVTLAGLGVVPSASLTAPTFSPTAVGSSSLANATLTNMGSGALSMTLPSTGSVAGSGFSFNATTCGVSLAVKASCTVTVQFRPSDTATNSGLLSVVTAAGTLTAPLGSTGIEGYAAVSPDALAFPVQQVGSTSAVQSVTVTNTGTGPLTLTGVGISVGTVDFGQSNNCGVVPVNGTCTVNVSFTPAAAGTREGILTFTHDGGGVANVVLAGTGQAPAAALSTPTFTDTVVGTGSSASVLLTNTGQGPLTLTLPPTLSSAGATDFSYSPTGTTCTPNLSAGAACSISIEFSPTAAMTRSATLSVATSAGVLTTSLTGAGLQGTATYSSTSLTYGPVQIASPATQMVSITNTGTASLKLTNIAIDSGSSDFVQFNVCATVLAVNATCTVSVTFTPSAIGPRTGTLTVLTDAPNGLGTISLSGTGQPGSAKFSNYDAPAIAVGTSTTGSVILTNTGVGPLTVVAPTATTVSGPGFSWQAGGSQCGGALATGATCNVNIVFTPTLDGVQSGIVTLNAGVAGTITAALTGTGQQGTATFSATSVSFANQTVTTTSETQSLILANTGTAPLQVTGISVVVESSDFGSTNDCAATLPVNGTCTINVAFTPSAAGPRSGTLMVTTNGSESATVIGLQGTGVAQASVSAASFAAASATVGSTEEFSWSLNDAAAAVVSCSGTADGSYSGTNLAGTLSVAASDVGAGSCTVTPVNALGVEGTPASASFLSVAAASVTSLSLGTSTATSGAGVGLSWATNGATSVVVACTGAVAYNYSGSAVNYTNAIAATTNTGTGTCTITAFNEAGTASTSASAAVTVVAPAAVVGFTASSQTVTSGSNAALSWSTSDATVVTVSCTGVASYSYSGPTVNYDGATVPTSTAGSSTCTLTAYNAAGTASSPSTLHLAVVSPASVNSVSLSPSVVSRGTSAGLSWATTGATSVSVACTGPGSYAYSGGSVNYSGGAVTTAGTGTSPCTVTAYNAAGDASVPVTASLAVVSAPEVSSVAFSPATVTSGANTTLTWETTGATAVSVSCSGTAAFTYNGASVNYAASVSTAGTGTGTCTVTATNAAGDSARSSTSLSVVAPPSVTGVAMSPTSVVSGGSTTFSWSTANATGATVACTAPAYGSGSGTSGSITVTTAGSGSGACTVTATNAAGTTATSSTGLAVSGAPANLSVSPTTFFPANQLDGVTVSQTETLTNTGGAGTLTWNSTASGVGYSTSTGTCPASGGTMAANSSCTFSVSWTGQGQCGGTLTVITGTTTATIGSVVATISKSAQRHVYKTTDPFCQ